MASVAETKDNIEIGSVLQRSFETLGSHFPLYAGLATLLVGIPSFLMQYLVLEAAAKATTDASYFDTLTPTYFASWLFVLLGSCVLQAIVVRSSIRHFGGMSADLGGSVANAFRFILPLIGLTIVTTVLIWVGMIFLIVPGIILAMMFAVAVPALVEEKSGVFKSMGRSRELTKGSRGRIFLLYLLLGILYAILFSIVGIVVAAIGSGGLLMQALLEGFAGVLTGIVFAAVLAALYFELRTVKEGATVQGLADIFG